MYKGVDLIWQNWMEEETKLLWLCLINAKVLGRKTSDRQRFSSSLNFKIWVRWGYSYLLAVAWCGNHPLVCFIIIHPLCFVCIMCLLVIHLHFTSDMSIIPGMVSGTRLQSTNLLQCFHIIVNWRFSIQYLVKHDIVIRAVFSFN